MKPGMAIGILFCVWAASFDLYGQQGSRYDVVVYGGTPGGVMAAVAASRNHAKVLLIEQTRHVGGLSTSGINTAESEHMINNAITGFAREFYIKMGTNFSEEYFQTFRNGRNMKFKKGDPAFFFESNVAEKELLTLLKDAQVDVLYEKQLTKTVVENKKISSITLDDGSSHTGSIFIDCTYEGDLMASAKVSYTWGRESIQQYNESYAGIRLTDDTLSSRTVDKKGKMLPYFSENKDLVNGRADIRVMNYNFRPTMTKETANARPVVKPENYSPERYQLLADYLKANPKTTLDDLVGILGRGNGKWEFNNQQNSTISLGLFGGNVDYPDADLKRRKEIYQDHKDYTLGYLYFLGHDPAVPKTLRDEMLSYGFARDEFKDNDNFPYYLYIREARRMQGDFVMTQNDILVNRQKDDAVTLGSHWIDSHHVQRVAVSKKAFTNEGRIWHTVTEPYEIPYRVILPKASEVTNLLVPVCGSLSHVAFCSYRLESTWMQMGHVAGTAAGLSLKYGVEPGAIPIEALQYKLRTEGMILKTTELGPYNDYKIVTIEDD
ncbi:MAG TPA: FAD-dependent oxidoreductase [Chryseolinea sp.]|nr:FAD-dependent oxidoreductase [Chryseolinea sp.]